MNPARTKSCADGCQVSGGRESMGDRIASEQRLLLGRSEHQHAARCSESLAQRGCYDRTVAEFLWKLGAHKTFAMLAKQRYPVSIVDVEKKAVAVLQPAQFLDRRMTSHRVNTVAYISHDGFIATQPF